MQEWLQYQRDLERSNLDAQTEQIKQDLLVKNQSKPIKIDILGREPQDWEPKINKSL